MIIINGNKIDSINKIFKNSNNIEENFKEKITILKVISNNFKNYI